MAARIRRRSTRKTGRLKRDRVVPGLPGRKRDAHKGDFGRVLVLGGSRGMIGAPALVAQAALRSGAGLVTIACPESIQLVVAALCPCATSFPLPEKRNGMLDPKAAMAAFLAGGPLAQATTPSVVAAGPGLGRGGKTFDTAWCRLIQAFGRHAGVPVVLDADGLNAMALSPSRRGGNRARHFRTVVTPHPGEMARLHGTTTSAVQRDREGFAVRTAELMSNGADDADHRVVVVLKGAGTLVTDGLRIYINEGGNPGMATGGSGDVLTGMIAALIGQGMPCYEAAVLGVHVHGLAGDLAALDFGEVPLVATDLIEYLPDAFGQV